MAASAAKLAETGFVTGFCCQISFEMLEGSPRTTARQADGGGAGSPAFWSSRRLPAADLIMGLIFEHLGQHLASSGVLFCPCRCVVPRVRRLSVSVMLQRYCDAHTSPKSINTTSSLQLLTATGMRCVCAEITPLVHAPRHFEVRTKHLTCPFVFFFKKATLHHLLCLCACCLRCSLSLSLFLKPGTRNKTGHTS